MLWYNVKGGEVWVKAINAVNAEKFIAELLENIVRGKRKKRQ